MECVFSDVVASAMLGVSSGQSVVDVVLWGGALILLVAALGVFIFVIRKRVLSGGGGMAADHWDLETLRQMHERGDLTDVEYKALKAGTIATLSEGVLSKGVSSPEEAGLK